MQVNIRLVYLYLFSFVGLLIIVIGSVQLVNLGMKVFVFPESDRYDYATLPMEGETSKEQVEQMREQAARDQQRTRQRDLSNSLAMLAVGIPLYVYHWKTIQKENRKSKK